MNKPIKNIGAKAKALGKKISPVLDKVPDGVYAALSFIGICALTGVIQTTIDFPLADSAWEIYTEEGRWPL